MVCQDRRMAGRRAHSRINKIKSTHTAAFGGRWTSVVWDRRSAVVHRSTAPVCTRVIDLDGLR
jgi:hypothetical protein